MSYPEPNLQRAKKLNILAYIATVIILLVVGGMRQVHLDLDIDFSFLPAFHSSVNALTAVFLTIAVWHIKNGRVAAHKKWIQIAMISSVIFLCSYILYHITTPETKYGGQGFVAYIYYFFLITHVILAGLILPFILFTYIRGLTWQIERHKKIARWVFPLWLYVTITGPICYLMLRPYYA